MGSSSFEDLGYIVVGASRIAVLREGGALAEIQPEPVHAKKEVSMEPYRVSLTSREQLVLTRE